MATLGDTFANDLAKLIFQGTAIANIADNAGTSPLTNLYVSFHTADPGDAGNQESNEATYTSYARVAIARSGSGFTVTGRIVKPAAVISAPTATGGSEILTHAAIGTEASGTGKILAKGALGSPITVTTGATPQLSTATQLTF